MPATLGLFMLLSRYLPESLRPIVRRVYFGSSDRTNNNSMIPPKRLLDLYGGGDFKKTGKEILALLIDAGRLQPSERILDVGCGVGRVAVALTEYLQDGRYEGFDVIPEGIEWCKRQLSPKFPNFNFQLADLHNRFYNPQGRYKPEEYKFPYHDDTFDLVLLTSVFTHMLTKDMEHYISEISRVLKTNSGRCIITFFLLNEETKQLIKEGKATLNFKFKVEEHCYTAFKDSYEEAIAYDESFTRQLFDKYNLTVLEPVRYGSWRTDDRLAKISSKYQDVIVATKHK